MWTSGAMVALEHLQIIQISNEKVINQEQIEQNQQTQQQQQHTIINITFEYMVQI